MKQPSPLTRQQLIDEFFIENRTRLLDVAAFLDRLDRAKIGSDGEDFRIEAFRKAVDALAQTGKSRVMTVQMIFSDPTLEPIDALDQKSAKGAYDPRVMEAVK